MKKKHNSSLWVWGIVFTSLLLILIYLANTFNEQFDRRVAFYRNSYGDEIALYHPFFWESEFIPGYYFRAHKDGKLIETVELGDLWHTDFKFITYPDSRIIAGYDDMYKPKILFFYDFSTNTSWHYANHITEANSKFVEKLNLYYPDKHYYLGSNKMFEIPENRLQQEIKKIENRYLITLPGEMTEIKIGTLDGSSSHYLRFSIPHANYELFLESLGTITKTDDYFIENDKRSATRNCPDWFKNLIQSGVIVEVSFNKGNYVNKQVPVYVDTSQDDQVTIYMFL